MSAAGMRRDVQRRVVVQPELPTSPWRGNDDGARMDDLPFRTEDGGGRRTKHRPNQVKPFGAGAKASLVLDEVAVPSQRRAATGVDAPPAPFSGASGARAQTQGPTAKEGIAATLDWELSEHEGLLTALEGRKRWFHCTKATWLVDDTAHNVVIHTRCPKGKQPIAVCDESRPYFCRCSYFNDRLYHSKMHYERIHVNNGKSMPRKRKYTESGTPTNNSPIPTPSPRPTSANATRPPSRATPNDVQAKAGSQKVTPTQPSKDFPPNLPSITGSPVALRTGALWRPSAVQGNKAQLSPAPTIISRARASGPSLLENKEMFSAAHARILTFGDGSFMTRSDKSHIGSGLSLNAASLRPPAGSSSSFQAATMGSPPKSKRAPSAPKDPTTPPREPAVSQLATPTPPHRSRPRSSSRHAETTLMMGSRDFFRPRSMHSATPPPNCRLGQRSDIELMASMDATERSSALQVTGFSPMRAHPSAKARRVAAGPGDIERLTCDETLSASCAFDDLDDTLDFAESSHDLLSWNPDHE